MRSVDGPVRPAVVVASAAAGAVEDAVLAGIEEEGVPYVVERTPVGAAVELARWAALRSPLGVGVGIDAGDVCVQPEKVADVVPELVSAADVATARVLGHNAARICVGLPLRFL
jgi:hypothetical protein